MAMQSNSSTIRTISNRQNERPLVMLHGMFGGLSNFEELITLLPDHQEVCVPELPLFEIERTNLSIKALADWLADLLEAKNISDCHLLGNSLGGHVALEFARRHPRCVSSLILTGSSGLMEEGLGDTQPKRFDREYVRSKIAYTFYDLKVPESLVDSVMEILGNRSKLLNIIELARQAHTQSVAPWLPAIPNPTLLIWGRNDQITPPEVATMFAKLLPHSQLEWIDQCGHAPMMEHPRAFSILLQTFIESLESETKEKSTSALTYE